MGRLAARLASIRLWQWLLFFVLGVFPYGDSHFGGPMQNSVIDLTTAIVESGRLSIDEYATNSPDVARKNGHFYSGLAPGLSFLAIPVYAIARTAVALMPAAVDRATERLGSRAAAITGRTLTPRFREIALTHFLLTLLAGGLAGALSVFLVNRISAHLLGSESAALTIALAYAFGTVMVYYTASYYTQSVATCLLLGAIYLLFLRRGTGALFWGGLLLGLAGITDYPYLLYGGLTLLFAVGVRRRRAGAWKEALPAVCAFSLPLLLAMVYHRACFGDWLATGYRYRAYVPYHAQSPLLGIGPPRIYRLWALLVSPDEGILLLFPFVILALWGLGRHLRGTWGAGLSRANGPHAGEAGSDIPSRAAPVTPEQARAGLVPLMVLLVAVCGLYFTCIPWRSDMGGYGPRFFLCGIAFLPLFSYPFDRRLRRVFAVLVAYSVAINHLNLMGLRPLHLLMGAPAAEGPQAQAVRMFPPLIRLSWSVGLLWDLAYQAALAGLVFVLLPRLLAGWERRRLGKRATAVSLPAGS